MAKVVAKLEFDAKTGTLQIKQFEKTANASLNKVGNTGSAMATKLGNDLKRAAQIGAAALVALSAVGIKESLKFEERFGNVQTLLADDAPLEQYKQGLMKLGRDGFADTAELADGLYQTISAGVKGAENQLQFLERATIAAKVGLASTFESVDLGTTVLNAFGLEASEAGRVFDEIQATIQQGKTTFRDLAGTVGTVAPAFALAKQSTDEMFASISTLTASGLSTEMATTALKNAVLSIIKPQDDAREAAKKYGIELSAAALESKGFTALMQELGEKTGGSAEAMTAIFPNIRAFQAAAILAGKGSRKLGEDIDVIRNSVGKLDNEWAEAQKRADVVFDKIKNSAKTALVEGFQPLIAGIADWFNEGDRIQAFGNTINNTIRGIAEFVADLGGKFVEYGKALAGAFTEFDIQNVLTNLKTAFDNVFNAVVGFIKSDAGKSLATFFSKIVELAGRVIGGLSGMVKPLADIIGKFAWIADFGSGIIDFFGGIAERIGLGVPKVDAYSEAVVDLTENMKDLNKEEITNYVILIKKKNETLKDEIDMLRDKVAAEEAHLSKLVEGTAVYKNNKATVDSYNRTLREKEDELKRNNALTTRAGIQANILAVAEGKVDIATQNATEALQDQGDESETTGKKNVFLGKSLEFAKNWFDDATKAAQEYNKVVGIYDQVLDDIKQKGKQFSADFDSLIEAGLPFDRIMQILATEWGQTFIEMQEHADRFGINLEESLPAYAYNSMEAVKNYAQRWAQQMIPILQMAMGFSMGGFGGVSSGGPSIWGDMGRAAGSAFVSSISSAMENLADLGKSIGVAFGSAFTSAMQTAFNKASDSFKNSFSGILAQIGIPILGNLASGFIGGILGGLFGGGESAAERAARMQEIQRKYQEQTNKMLGEFVDKLKDLIAVDIFEWGSDLNDMMVRLKGRGADFTDALDLVADAITRTEQDIEDAVKRLGELPRELYDAFVSIDEARRSIADMKDSIRDTKDLFKELAKGPQRYAQATRELQRAQDELKAAEKDGSDKRIQAARDWVDTATKAVEDLKDVSAGLLFGGEERNQARIDIMKGIRDAQKGDLLRSGRITLGEERELLKQAGNEQTRLLISQLVAQQNALTEAKLRLQVMKDQRKALRQEQRRIEKDLPTMRDHLDSLKTLQEKMIEINERDSGQRHRDLEDIKGLLRDDGPRRASGGPIYGYQQYIVGEEGTEYVMQNRAVRQYGMDFMRQVNEGSYRPSSNGGSSAPVVQETQQNNITIVAWDGESVERWLRKGNNGRVLANAVVREQKFNAANRN